MVPPRKVEPNEAFAEFLLDLRQRIQRIDQQSFDFSHPVDEYQSGPGVPSSLQIEVLPTYDKFSERIERVVVVVGTTATGLVLTLGDRVIPLNTGFSTSTPAINQIPLGATGVASYNNNSVGVNQTITGGTVTAIAINGTTTGLTSGTFFVPAGGTVTVTYSVAPTTFNTAAIAVTTPASGSNAGVICFDCGFVLKSHERRLLTATSWGNTNGFLVALFGHASDVFETV